MNQTSPVGRRSTTPDRIIAGVIFGIAFLIFWLSPVHQVTDSTYSMLVSQSLLKFHSFALDHYAMSPTEVQEHTQLEKVTGHVYYYYPAGGPVLSLPFVALMNVFNMTAANKDGSYRLRGEKEMQAIVAPLLMAALASIFFFSARLVLPTAWSVLIALAAAFGTQVWSTASRALWSHTWEIVLLGVAIWMLLAAETGKHKLRPTVLATVLAWTYFARPTGAAPILAISLYILLVKRRLILPYAVAGFSWAVTFVLYSWIHFGSFLPRYYRQNISIVNPWPSLSGNLFSPSRGLLIYVPVTLFVGFLLIRYWKEITLRRLVWLALLALLVHFMILSSLSMWWGGGCYGARLTTELVPWFVLLGILGVGAMLRSRARTEMGVWTLNWCVPLAGGLVLLMFSVFINARGAISLETANWETWRWQRPAVERDTSVLWDWRYPQFLAGVLHPPLPDAFPLAAGNIELGSPESSKYLWYGWSGPEPPTRWTDGHEAAIIFSLSDTTDVVIEMKLAPFLAGKLEQQDLHLYLNDHPIGSLQLAGPEMREVSFSLQSELLRNKNVLRFSAPGASSPYVVGGGEDERLLGVKLEWVRFRPLGKDQPQALR